MNPIEQHLATRRDAALFDFSFMSLVEVDGPAALTFLEHLQTRSIANLGEGRIVYTLLLNDDATVFVDATLWRIAVDRWWLFTGRRSDVSIIEAHAPSFGARIRDRSGEFVVLALQGPNSGHMLAKVVGEAHVHDLGYFRFVEVRIGYGDCIVGRLGYSGELGYEIVAPNEQSEALRATFVDAGAAVCGFDAANSLRVESGHVLFDREITNRENPLELGFDRLVDLDGRAFRGRDALESLRRARVERRFVGLEIEDHTASSELPIAHATSECDSPILRRRIALGFAPASLRAGDRVRLIDGRAATVARLPFYDPARRLPRSDPL